MTKCGKFLCTGAMQQAKWQNMGGSHFGKASPASITIPYNTEREGNYPACLTARDAAASPGWMVGYIRFLMQ